MIPNKIFCFGDSWTLGQGCQFEPGTGNKLTSEKYDKKLLPLLDQYSYPAVLGKLLENKVKVINKGSNGAGNKDIFQNILHDIHNGNIHKNDLVIIGWTSIIREHIPFFESVNGHQVLPNGFFAMKNMDTAEKINFGGIIKKEKLQKFYEDAFKDYISYRLNFDWFYEIVLNYICNLQIIFDGFGINYLFFNAFENVTNTNIKVKEFINMDKWILPESTFSDYLCDIEENLTFESGYSLWEDDFIKPGRNHDGPHPNRIGYELIAKKIYDFLISQKII